MSKSVMHRAITTHYYGGERYAIKVFDYNDGLKLDDKFIDDSYVINVPCYNLEDLSMMNTGTAYRNCSVMYYWQKFQHMISIQTCNHKGKQYQYLIATPEIEKYVAEQTLVGILKGYITKAPKRHLKIVRVHHRGRFKHHIFKKAPIKTDAYAMDKFTSDGILYDVKHRTGMIEQL